jgi:hypothetical protein
MPIKTVFKSIEYILTPGFLALFLFAVVSIGGLLTYRLYFCDSRRRIGINDFGQTQNLIGFAEEGFTSEARKSVLKCVHYVGKAVLMIREEFPSARIVLVGIFDNSNWAPNLSKWQSPGELANIHEARDLYDNIPIAFSRQRSK